MWNIITVNESCDKVNRFRIHKEHLERLLQSRAMINNIGMETPNFLKIPSTLRYKFKEEQKQIDRENRKVYGRMCDIQKHKSPYSSCLNIPAPCPAFDFQKNGYNKKYKLKEIHKMNQWLGNRFTEAKSFYPRKKFLKEDRYNNYLKNGILHRNCSNPNMNFSTYAEFKKKLIKRLKLVGNDRFIPNKLTRSMSCKNSRIPSAFVTPKYNSYSNGFFKNKSRTPKMTISSSNSKKLTRCQSAYLNNRPLYSGNVRENERYVSNKNNPQYKFQSQSIGKKIDYEDYDYEL